MHYKIQVTINGVIGCTRWYENGATFFREEVDRLRGMTHEMIDLVSMDELPEDEADHYFRPSFPVTETGERVRLFCEWVESRISMAIKIRELTEKLEKSVRPNEYKEPPTIVEVNGHLAWLYLPIGSYAIESVLTAAIIANERDRPVYVKHNFGWVCVPPYGPVSRDYVHEQLTTPATDPESFARGCRDLLCLPPSSIPFTEAEAKAVYGKMKNWPESRYS